jgi:hypothetical protein
MARLWQVRQATPAAWWLAAEWQRRQVATPGGRCAAWKRPAWQERQLLMAEP